DVRWEVLRDRLDRVAGLLVDQGCLTSRRTGRSSHAWSVRYFDIVGDRREQRALYVGSDPVIVERTRDYLAALRNETEWIRGLPALCRASRGLMRSLRRAKKSSG